MQDLQEEIQHITKEYFKIVGCGTCGSNGNSPYCSSCSMNKGSGSYYHVSDKYASDFAETICLLIKEGADK
jgi:hypothetical protein